MREDATTSERSSSNKKIANRIVTLSSAAVLAIYAAGFLRTRSAAQQFEIAAAERRPVVPAPAPVGPPRDAPPASMIIGTIGAAGAARPLVGEAVPAAGSPKRVAGVQATRTGSDQPESASASAPTLTPATLAPGPTENSALHVPIPTVAAASTDGPVITEGTAQTSEPPASPRSQYKDGTYSGWGTSRHGDIQASVVIAGGRIASATIAQCLTRYSCSWIAHLPPQVVSRQSADVDYVSGATQSADAFYGAITEALSKAK